ncbi:hypothetical protein KUTeg_006040 [Tegillarca granosa]|uniref:Major facilitator superfamily (MFS) profile domain-containing protein n=1 Tax=Tegillarca granosa TaxID=220873 RepID=A0ABQ9FFD5_TEGGR|nr:hypothetical protein KUTeg_006040 [Tegillarca granosa]
MTAFNTGIIGYSFGIINVAFLQRYEQNVATTAIIGSVFLGALFMTAPVASMSIKKFSCRVTQIIGGILAFVGFSSGFFVDSLQMFSLTYGVLGGSGMSLCYTVCHVIVCFHFKKYLGLAFGLTIAAIGVGLLASGPVIQSLIDTYGLHGAFMLIGAIALNNVPLALLMFPSNAEISVQEEKSDSDKEHINKMFHLPNLSVLSGSSAHEAALLNTALGIGSTINRLITGVAVGPEGVDPLLLYFGFNGILGLLSLTFPLYFVTYTSQFIYCVIHGTYTGGVNAVRSPLYLQIVGLQYHSTAVGLMFFVEGIAFLVGPPLGGKYDLENRPIASIVIHRFSCRVTQILGGILAFVGFSAGFFVESLEMFSLTYGLMAGSGMSLCYTVCHVIICFHFKKYLGLAFGITIAAIVFPKTAEMPVKRKRNNSKQDKRNQNSRNLCQVCQWDIFKIKSFAIVLTADFFYSLPYAIILFHLPNLSVISGSSTDDAALLYTAIGIGSTINRLLTGLAIGPEGVDPLLLYLGFNGILGLLSLTFPLYFGTYTSQFIYCVIHGTYTGGVNAVRSPLYLQIVGLHYHPTAVGLMFFVEGIAFIIGPPLGGPIASSGLNLCYTVCYVINCFHFKKYLGLAFGITVSAIGLGLLASGPVIQFLIDTYGLHGAFLLMGGMALNNVTFAFLLFPTSAEISMKKERISAKHDKTIKDSCNPCQVFQCNIFKIKSFVIVLAADFLFSLPYAITVFHLPNLSVLSGSSTDEAALLNTALGIGSTTFRLIAGIAIGPEGIDPLLLFLGFNGLLGFLSLTFPLYYWTYTGRFIFCVLYGSYSGGVNGVRNPLYLLLADQQYYSTAIGLMLFAEGIAFVIGPPLGGWIFDITGSYELSFYIAEK